MANQVVSGHVTLIKRKRGEKWYAKYRLPDGRQRFRLLGPAWKERSRPPAGYHTRKTAEAELEAILTDARRGELPDLAPASGRTLSDAVEVWLAYVRDEKGRRSSTVRDYRNTANGSLLEEFGKDT